MSITSMTGFAQSVGNFENFRWSWEIKSLNGKRLDVRFRVPNWLEGIDFEGKKEISKFFSRGSIFAHLEINKNGTSEKVIINKEILNQLLDLAHEYEAQPSIKPASLDGLLRIKGILTIQDQKLDENTQSKMKDYLLSKFRKTLEGLKTARGEEGSKLEVIILKQLDGLENLLKKAANTDGARLDIMKKKMSEKVNNLLSDDNKLSSERLEQEIALFAVKVDIREEIDRLSAHFESARELITKGGAVGRKLDFLCQELNRETNTICSKSGDVELTRIGLSMKNLVDQFREQIQNIE